MKIRTIHHQACTGGTLISKCIAALDSVCLLSEVHPEEIIRIRHRPTEILSQFITQYPEIGDPLLPKYFHTQVDLIVEACESNNRTLVLRDHSHSDYFRGRRRPRTLLKYLEDYEVQSLVTIRDPIDSYLSALEKGWLDAVHGDFNLYCNRLRDFMDDNADLPVVKYEDFCDNPHKSMKQICKHLSLNYDESFIRSFNDIELTGDSGRRSDTIEKRPRRPITEELRSQIAASGHYRRFCSLHGYKALTLPA